ncbi:MAG: trypsin-like peptidase domain-containing protein [Candidatus Bathyarchaeia archaeon]|jgi:S1-C subfamily serine protease
MELPQKPKVSRLTTALIAAVIICLLAGGTLGYAISSFTLSNQNNDLQSRISALENQVSTLENNVSTLQSATNVSTQVINLQSRLSVLENQVSALQSTANVSSQISDLQSRISVLEEQVSNLQSTINSFTQNVTYQNITYFLGENFSLSQLYEQIKSSVVVVQGIIVQYDFFGQPYYAEVQGSGFVSNLTGQFVIVTNYHVVDGATNITVTFIDGDAYSATVTGSDPYADLAVLSANAPQHEYVPLTITSSSTLRVGDPVLAVGNPYGLAGSVTSGIVSALGRTITESTAGAYAIADCIQTTTPINAGNSGGPLLNYLGEVVGITAAIVSNSQGLGFAIPSSSILREIASLITNGSYNNHSWLGASGTDMTLGIAQAMNTSVTYGWLIAQVTSQGPADKAGLRAGTTQVQVDGTSVTIGGDIILALNGTRIRNSDDLSTYVEEYTLPGQTISVAVVRNNATLTLPLTLGTRPPPT